MKFKRLTTLKRPTYRVALFLTLLTAINTAAGFQSNSFSDGELYQLVDVFALKRRSSQPGQSAKARLGELLFFDRELSGNRNISCSDCHHPRLATADELPFSIGEGGAGIGLKRIRNQARVTRRSAPTLWNLHGEIPAQFWDGRVFYDRSANAYYTPEPALNGPTPFLGAIVEQFRGSLAAQSVFPMVDMHEMMGLPGTNEISSQKSRPAQWEAISRRIANPMQPASQKAGMYQQLFRNIYPDVLSGHVVNIGHIGNALQAFIESQLRSPETRFDEFTRGNSNALTKFEKDGMRIFFKRAFCGACHNGPELSNNRFFNIGSPHIFIQSHKNSLDDGRIEITGSGDDFNAFKTPQLRGIQFSAPYFHNGAFTSLRQVIEHYNDIGKSLSQYQSPQFYSNLYGELIVADKDRSRNDQRLNQIKLPFLKEGLHLSEAEKQSLEAFLRTL